jgi:tumor protein p53-inducible protein 3
LTIFDREIIAVKAITISKFGGPKVLTIQDVPRPTVKSGQVLVKVSAIGVNRADILQRLGKYPPPSGHNELLGLEIAGEIVEVDGQTEADRAMMGQRVCGLVNGGGYAEYCILDKKMAIEIPPELTYTEAAGIPEAFLTAYCALFEKGELKSKESVLIHAGGSGVGTAAIQLAKVSGANVYVTAGSDEKINKAIELGALAGINHNAHDFAISIMQMTNQMGVDVIIDCIGEVYATRNLMILNTDGRLIEIAGMTGTHCHWDLAVILRKRLQIKGLTMRSRPMAEKRNFTKQFVQHWLPLFETKEIKPVIDTVFPFEKVNAAHQYMEANKNFGKIILEL